MARSRACWNKPEARLGHLATGFAIRRGIVYRRSADLRTPGTGDAFQRWGVDVTLTADGRRLRLLSVHLRTGCWGEPQDRDAERRKTCATLRGQIERLKAWADARRVEGVPFIILGDFNRRLALPGNWGWRLLSPPSAPLRLLTEGVAFRCDPRFPAFIDHMVAGGGAEAMLAPGSFREADSGLTRKASVSSAKSSTAARPWTQVRAMSACRQADRIWTGDMFPLACAQKRA